MSDRSSSSPPVPAEDEREWILRWAHRQLRHYIDGPTHGEIEGVVVVPKSVLVAERTRSSRLEEQNAELERTQAALIEKLARALCGGDSE